MGSLMVHGVFGWLAGFGGAEATETVAHRAGLAAWVSAEDARRCSVSGVCT